MLVTNISISLDDALVAWLDELVENGIINSRSEAIRGAIHLYIREKLGIKMREELRTYLKNKQKKPFESPMTTIQSIREEKS